MITELPSWLYYTCTAIGFWNVLPLLRAVFGYFQRNFMYVYPWSQLGEWAVITGGTDGIGKAYAQELASKGFNICIISRNREKLITVLREIGDVYHVSTKAINIDFTDGPKIYEEIEEILKDLQGDIGVLVNNVGMSYPYAEYFHDLPEGFQAIQNMISSNVTACTMMMRIVLPWMEKRRKGLIINVSSLTAIYPMPLLAVYAASKAYVDYVSRAVHFEYKDKGIFVQSLLPGYVATKMSNRKTRLEVPSPEVFVASAIKTVGVENYSYGYLPHKIRGFVHEWLKANMPAFVNLAIAMHYMSKARESYFRKLKRKREEKNEQKSEEEKNEQKSEEEKNEQKSEEEKNEQKSEGEKNEQKSEEEKNEQKSEKSSSF